MNYIITPISFILIIISLSLLSCTKDKGPIEPDVNVTTVSFINDIQPIFNADCIACHNTANNQFYGYLDLSEGNSYNDLISVVSNGYAPEKRVVINDSDASVLWQKVNNSSLYGSNMPLGGSLSNTDIEKIRVWIDEGAQNN
jgi:hypothetical protein